MGGAGGGKWEGHVGEVGGACGGKWEHVEKWDEHVGGSGRGM